MQSLITVLEVIAGILALGTMIYLVYKYFKRNTKFIKQKLESKLIEGKVVEKRKLNALAGGLPPFIYYLVIKDGEQRKEIYVSESDYQRINLGEYIRETSFGKIEKIEKRD